MSDLGHSRNRLVFGATAFTLALAPLGCSSENGEVTASLEAAAPDNDDGAEVLQSAVTLEETRSARDINQQREDEALVTWVGDVERQAQLTEVLSSQLPGRIPTFANVSARTRLAEHSPGQILGVLGYRLDSTGVVEADKLVFDDGAVRLRTSLSVPGYFKFADRAALYEAHRKVGNTAPAPIERIERGAVDILDTLGVPSSEIVRVRAHAVTLDTGSRSGETHTYGTAAYVSNVHRQVGGLPVLGSACTLSFDIEGTLTWARCRWPQFQLSPSSTSAQDRDYDAILSDMARQLDFSMAPSSSATDVQLSTGFAYEERVTEDGVHYVPVLRTVLSSPNQAAAEFTTLVRHETSMGDDAGKPARVQF